MRKEFDRITTFEMGSVHVGLAIQHHAEQLPAGRARRRTRSTSKWEDDDQLVRKRELRPVPPKYPDSMWSFRNPCWPHPQEDTFDQYVVPAGSDIFISVWNLHRSPALWDEPEKFKPERCAGEWLAVKRIRPAAVYAAGLTGGPGLGAPWTLGG